MSSAESTTPKTKGTKARKETKVTHTVVGSFELVTPENIEFEFPKTIYHFVTECVTCFVFHF